MSRESLLDEAIAKAKEAEDWQLAEWLRMARGADKAGKWYTAKIRELEDKNKKLSERGGKLFDKVLELTEENAKLMELAVSMYYDLSHMMFPPGWAKDYAAEMRALGIEVDG